MSEPENFLSRWSRRKQEAEQEAREDAPPDAGEAATPSPKADAAADASDPRPGAEEKPEAEFDVSSLPPIESIGSATDIRIFLQKGVPQELTRAALRRAWTTDPAIRDFIEIAENQWDFATGSDIPGFGPLHPTDDVRRLVAEVFGETPKLPVPEPPADMAAAGQTEAQPPVNQADLLSSADGGTCREDKPPELQDAATAGGADPAEVVIVQRKEELVAMQQEPEKSDSAMPVRRTHGRALPQ